MNQRQAVSMGAMTNVSDTNGSTKKSYLPTPLGRRLKEQRNIRGWSQFEMAERANLSNGFVSQLETGVRGRRVRRDDVLKIAKAFNEPEEYWLQLTRFADDSMAEFDERPAFTVFVDSDPLLTDEQKMALKASYIAFTARRR